LLHCVILKFAIEEQSHFKLMMSNRSDPYYQRE
jgi:hypothetical protein